MRFLPLLLATATSVGAAVGITWPWVGRPGGWLLVATAVLAPVAVYRQRRPWLVTAVVAGVLAVAAIRGALAIEGAGHSPLLEALDAGGVGADLRPAVTLEGRLAADAAVADRGVLLRLDVARVWLGPCGCPEPVHEGVLVTVGGLPPAMAISTWRGGRLVRVSGTVRRARGYWNLGAPDAVHDRLGRGYGLVVSVKSAWLVEVRARGNWADEALAALRAHARRAIATAAGDDAVAAAIATAVLIGDRAGLDPELVGRLQRAGTFHVVAISGGNIAILVLGVTAAVRRVVARPALLAILAGAVIAAYAVLVGGGASVARATGMALVGLAVLAVDVRAAAVNVLAATTCVLVLVAPALAVDAGFLLTTAATLGVLAGAATRRPRTRWWADVGAAALRTSVAAEVAILPIQTTVFQQVTVAGPLLNLAAIPGMALVQVSAMAVVAVAPVSDQLAALAGVAMRAGAHLVVETAALVDAWPWLAWHVSPPAGWAILAYYLAIAAAWWSVRAASSTAAPLRRPAMAAAASAAIWIGVAPWDFVRPPAGTLTMTVFDVGQGDAALVTFPDGAHLVVDAGGARPGGFDVGARVVGPALRARGIRRLDYLLVTHADADHIGGAATLVRDFRPREVWTGIPVDGDAATARLKTAAQAVGAAWRPVRHGQQLEIAGVEVEVLHPPDPDWDRQRVRNDDSVALQISWRGIRFVLTGDIGAEVERGLGDATVGAWRRTVLKVAHHGSAGSSDASFLARLRPDVAVISAGEGNPFGHPAPATLLRLDVVGADVWRTDLSGETTVRTDGTSLQVSAITGRRKTVVVRP